MSTCGREKYKVIIYHFFLDLKPLLEDMEYEFISHLSRNLTVSFYTLVNKGTFP